MGKLSGSIIMIIIVVLIIGIFYYSLSRASDPVRVLNKQADFMTFGNVTFIEIGNYSHEGTRNQTLVVNQILDEWDVSYAYYNFGTDEDNLMFAAAVECAGYYGERKGMHDFLRETQRTRSEIYFQTKELQLDIGTFQRCMEDDKIFDRKIEEINKKIARLKLETSPVYIINGKLYEGDIDFESLSEKINQSEGL